MVNNVSIDIRMLAHVHKENNQNEVVPFSTKGKAPTLELERRTAPMMATTNKFKCAILCYFLFCLSRVLSTWFFLVMEVKSQSCRNVYTKASTGCLVTVVDCDDSPFLFLYLVENRREQAGNLAAIQLESIILEKNKRANPAAVLIRLFQNMTYGTMISDLLFSDILYVDGWQSEVE